MKIFRGMLVVAFAFMIVQVIALAEGKTDSLEVGSDLGAFQVTKLAGAESDGVEAGKSLCYRCKNGSRPQVIVFTRSTDEKVVSLVKELDKVVSEKEDKELASFVNVLGEDKDKASDEAKKLAAAADVKNIAFVVPADVENGPASYKMDHDTALKVVVANEGKIVAVHGVAKSDQLDIKAVLAEVNSMLN